MKIVFQQWYGGEAATYRPGDVADLPRKIAQNLIERGAAQKYRAAAIETTAAATPENAMAVSKPAKRGRVATVLRGLF